MWEDKIFKIVQISFYQVIYDQNHPPTLDYPTPRKRKNKGRALFPKII